MIFHIDIDAFFASVEEKYYPEYKHLPLVVGGQVQSGVVGTCNYVARKYGVVKGETVAKAYGKCSNLVAINNHKNRYEYWSKRFFAYLKERYTDLIEVASIDECYVQVDNLLPQYHDNPLLLATIIQKDVLNDLGLSISIGIASTKEIAKITTGFKKPFGISYTKDDELATKIHPLPIDKIVGLGKKTLPILKQYHIETISDYLADQNDFLISDLLGVNYYKLKNGLLGKGHFEIDLTNNNSKSIEKSCRFKNSEWDEKIIKKKIQQLGYVVLNELNDQAKKAKSITVYLKYKDHLTHKKMKSLPATNNYQTLLSNWLALFYQLWDNEEPLLLIGVGVTKLV